MRLEDGTVSLRIGKVESLWRFVPFYEQNIFSMDAALEVRASVGLNKDVKYLDADSIKKVDAKEWYKEAS